VGKAAQTGPREVSFLMLWSAAQASGLVSLLARVERSTAFGR
jgi:hypothetical protein